MVFASDCSMVSCAIEVKSLLSSNPGPSVMVAYGGVVTTNGNKRRQLDAGAFRLQAPIGHSIVKTSNLENQ